MSFDAIPRDAIRIILQHLDSKGLCAVRGVSTVLLTEASEEGLWEKVCRRELGCNGGRVRFLQVAFLNEISFVGAVVVPYKMAGVFRGKLPEIAEKYDLSGYLIDPIPVRITLTRDGTSLVVKMEFYKVDKIDDDSAPKSDLERAFLAATPRSELTETNKIHTTEVFGKFYGRGEVDFLGFNGEILNKKCLIASSTYGCLYAALENASRDYSFIKTGSVWKGTCHQNGLHDSIYPMELDISQASENSGVVQGIVTFASLSAKTRFAGVTGIPPTDSSPTPTPIQTKAGDPPPPLCTLFSTPPLRPLNHRFTRFSFTEYQIVKKGSTVVPTSYSAVVLGDVMVGTYKDYTVCNHGVFCLIAGD